MHPYDQWAAARSTAHRAPGLQGDDCRPCNCIGPQNGQPVCPCQMRGVTVENGRYVKRVDLGPVPPHRKATLDERIAQAQAEVASWPPEKRATMQLQGNPYPSNYD